jgi:hypothetical protein
MQSCEFGSLSLSLLSLALLLLHEFATPGAKERALSRILPGVVLISEFLPGFCFTPVTLFIVVIYILTIATEMAKLGLLLESLTVLAAVLPSQVPLMAAKPPAEAA